MQIPIPTLLRAPLLRVLLVPIPTLLRAPLLQALPSLMVPIPMLVLRRLVHHASSLIGEVGSACKHVTCAIVKATVPQPISLDQQPRRVNFHQQPTSDKQG